MDLFNRSIPSRAQFYTGGPNSEALSFKNESWSYHVAVVVTQNSTDYILDPIFKQGVLTRKKWEASLRAANTRPEDIDSFKSEYAWWAFPNESMGIPENEIISSTKQMPKIPIDEIKKHFKTLDLYLLVEGKLSLLSDTLLKSKRKILIQKTYHHLKKRSQKKLDWEEYLASTQQSNLDCIEKIRQTYTTDKLKKRGYYGAIYDVCH